MRIPAEAEHYFRRETEDGVLGGTERPSGQAAGAAPAGITHSSNTFPPRGGGARLLLLAALLITYSKHFDNAFHFDDWHTIETNAFIRDLRVPFAVAVTADKV